MAVTRRKAAKSDDSKTDKIEKPEETNQESNSKGSKLVPIFILAAAIAAGVFAYKQDVDLLANTAESYQNKYKDESKRPAVGTGSGSSTDLSNVIAPDGQIFTASDLKQYNGDDPQKPIYLAVLGQVFDVTKGKEHYGKGGGYNFFSGRDGTRAFVTGDFSEKGLNDEIKGLSHENFIGIKEWIDFYHKDYSYVGKLIGRFYNAKGEPAPILSKIKTRLSKAYALRKEAENENFKMPGCNTHWTKEEGTVYWCEKKSGGIERDWVGVPRKLFYENGKFKRCACIRTKGPSSFESSKNSNNGDLDYHLLKEYDGCAFASTTCSANDAE